MSSSTLLLLFTRMVRSLWFTPALYALLAIGSLLLAPRISPYLPEGMKTLIGLDGVYDLLNVLANTLLAVAIFSLGILASAMQAAAGTATPRARPLLMNDRTAQNAISTFIGGFIFAIVGIVGLSTAYFDEASRVVVFFVSCFVILAVIYALIRWIGRLSKIGDVSEVIDQVETAAEKAFRNVAKAPVFGGVSTEESPRGGFEIRPLSLGFVQAIDADALGDLAREHDCDLHLEARPGAYVDPSRPLANAARRLDDKTCGAIRDAFLIGGQRTFEADPRFGLIVLSEIASRALSLGVNDPGTAIDVIGTTTRVLAGWSEAAGKHRPEVKHPRLHAAPLDVHDVLVDAFRWIARDGAGQLEVQIRLQRALATLVALDPAMFGAAGRALSHEALERAELALDLPQDIARLRGLVVQLNL